MTDAIQLSKLPPPDVVDALDFEAIYAIGGAKLKELWDDFDPAKESSLPAKVLQSIAYIALIQRQLVNDSARAVMLATARGADLQNLGALFGVEKLVIEPADPENGVLEPVMEDDEDYRERITLAPSSFSVAGPSAAYRFHARSASGDVLDASATSPEPDDIKALVSAVLQRHGASVELAEDMAETLESADWPGDVLVSVLARSDDGTAPQALLDTVDATVGAESVRPLTDHVIVKSAEILRFKVVAKMWSFAGPDSDVAMSAARKSLDAYLAGSRRLGRDITLSGLYAALQVPGIQNVELISPTETIVANDKQAAYCESIDLTYEGVSA